MRNIEFFIVSIWGEKSFFWRKYWFFSILMLWKQWRFTLSEICSLKLKMCNFENICFPHLISWDPTIKMWRIHIHCPIKAEYSEIVGVVIEIRENSYLPPTGPVNLKHLHRVSLWYIENIICTSNFHKITHKFPMKFQIYIEFGNLTSNWCCVTSKKLNFDVVRVPLFVPQQSKTLSLKSSKVTRNSRKSKFFPNTS